MSTRQTKFTSLATSASFILVLAGCAMTLPAPTSSVDFEQHVARDLPASDVLGPIASLSADGSELRVERWDSPACWSVPVEVTQEGIDALSVQFEVEPSTEESSCPNSAAWVVSDIQLAEPVSVESVTVHLSGPSMRLDEAPVIATRRSS